MSPARADNVPAGEPPAIEICGLRKVYRGRGGPVVAVDGVSLTVPQAQIFGFLGRNGAGKTTTIKVLLGLIPRFEGEARLFGVSCTKVEARQPVGYLSETPAYHGSLSVRQVLMFHAALHGVARSRRRAHADELIEAVGLAAVAFRQVRELSKGMLQRLGIAAALVGDPRLVLLDEPTANLDPVGRRDIKQLLLDLKARGTTVFLNSHMLSEIEMTCDRVAIIDRGKVVREGEIAELTRMRRYVHIGVTQISDELLRALGEVARDVRVVGRYIVGEIDGESDLDPIPGIVERCGARLRYLAMAQSSLEEVFFDAVLGGEGAGGARPAGGAERR